MSETKKNKRKPKSKPKEKKPKPKEKKPRPKPKPKPKEKKRKSKEQVSNHGKVIVQLEENKQEKDENVYTNKLKSLINKIKNQNEYTDSGIRFAWRN